LLPKRKNREVGLTAPTFPPHGYWEEEEKMKE
jgi:hypothetical protein